MHDVFYIVGHWEAKSYEYGRHYDGKAHDIIWCPKLKKKNNK